MPDVFSVKARLLSNLSNEVRLQLLYMIMDKEVSVGDMAQSLGIRQSALSQHLARLRGDRLVRTRKVAQTVYYRCDHLAVRRLLETLSEIYKTRPSAEAA
ncbi:metalloregulator ArsR/SmtB family transcription factor (plasmid) [Rhizobium rhododendri]|uniref:Metalloregulator ArsR/SmtB family transcription factor n=2 Tax=Rhizobium rhododendri TaxID=2506430 RepID=A0ABY8IPB2_9HYPH|nr:MULTISPECIES: metalloregulator ArsR/SmtB family transcription factor [Rhizobium]WFS24875.1 metalloregulator ArsR/SmtB family transcription factor [Rhizobium rhododendri]